MAVKEDIIGWLEFLRDFGNLDTTKLITQAQTDDDLVAAIDVAAQAGVTSAQRLDHVRDFCISMLFGEAPEQKPPQQRQLSPFSVPWEMLKETFGRHTKGAYIWHKHVFEEVTDWHRNWYLDNNIDPEPYLLTSMKLYNLSCTELPKDARFELLDRACNRNICRVYMPALIAAPVPLYYFLQSHSGLEVRIRGGGSTLPNPPARFCLAFEGWKCRRDR